jgi:hypothetical protein
MMFVGSVDSTKTKSEPRKSAFAFPSLFSKYWPIIEPSSSSKVMNASTGFVSDSNCSSLSFEI